jgi:hypothetical protein
MTNYRVLSLGAGVQSSTVALMIARGLIEPIDCAIFSDTGAEPRGVYDWLDWLEPQLPFPVHRVQWKEGLTKNIEQSVAGGRFAGAPFFAMTHKGPGPLHRQCTREFKIQPIERKLRELMGIKPRSRGPRDVAVTQLFGISVDEIYRVRVSRTRWIKNEYPLVERRMTRHDCLNWMQLSGYPQPPRSACVYCPYHSDHEWRQLRDTDPEGWAEAVRVDEVIRTGVRGTRDPLYVHRSLKPLAEVDLSTAEEHGQISMFINECEGMCGV